MLVVWFSLVVGFVIATLALYVLPSISRRRRNRKLLERPVWPFDEWYDEFYGSNGPDRELVRQVHQALAEEIKVNATQIYPTDRFDRELLRPEWWGDGEYERGCILARLGDLICENGKEVPKDWCWRYPTVGGLIKELEGLLG